MKQIKKNSYCTNINFVNIDDTNNGCKCSKKVKLSRTTVTIYVGKTVTLKLKNNKNKVRWSSSNRNIATVTKKVRLRGRKPAKQQLLQK